MAREATRQCLRTTGLTVRRLSALAVSTNSSSTRADLLGDLDRIDYMDLDGELRL